MIKAVLFDMDGVITDTEKFYNESWTRAMHECGYPQFTRTDALMLRSCNHQDGERLLKEHFGDTIDYNKVHSCSNRIVEEIIQREGIPLKPGIAEILAYLKSHHIKSAVATATKYERASARLKDIGLFDQFDTVISASMVAHGKPYPDVYLYASKAIGQRPEECIAVEDSPNGVKSASAAGCKTIMVPDLTQPDQELLPLLYGTANTLMDLIPMIEQMQTN